MKLLAAREWNKIYNEDGFKYRIKVQAELIHFDGNSNAHFSITGEIKRKAKNNRWVEDCGGAIHEQIVKHFPRLQELVDIHLSDEDGIPMHAYDNAGYWAGHSGTATASNLPMLARHLRVREEVVRKMIGHIEHYYGTDFDATTTYKQVWQETCAEFDLPQQWAAEAVTARAMLNEVLERV